MKTFHFIPWGVWIIGVLVFPTAANAARVYFEPSGGSYRVGDSATVIIKLDTQGESINAVDLHFLYPKILRMKSISKSGSSIQLWVQDPSFSGSEISISGGAPGGLQGVVTLARVSLEGAAVGDGRFGLGGGSVALLNDGQGTPAQLSIATADFHVTARAPGIAATPSVVPKTSPAARESAPATPSRPKNDTKRPEKFAIAIATDARVFNGKHFAAFFSTDAQSGVDYYEIKEGSGPFRVARSPYLLSDQKLRSVVRVRAYDGAGNYRESVYPDILGRIWLWIVNLVTRS